VGLSRGESGSGGRIRMSDRAASSRRARESRYFLTPAQTSARTLYQWERAASMSGFGQAARGARVARYWLSHAIRAGELPCSGTTSRRRARLASRLRSSPPPESRVTTARTTRERASFTVAASTSLGRTRGLGRTALRHRRSRRTRSDRPKRAAHRAPRCRSARSSGQTGCGCGRSS